MSYINNYAHNRKIMEKGFAKTEVICRENGMLEESIEEIYCMDLALLNNDRRFYTHTQSYDGAQFADGGETNEGHSPLLGKFQEQLSVAQAEICGWSRMSWIEDLDTEEVILWVKGQTEKNLELLTLIVVDGLKQTEVAKMWKVSDAAISKRMKKMKKSLEKVLPEWLKKKYV